MKKILFFIPILILLIGFLSGCGESTGTATDDNDLTLKQIRKAAEDSGYTVTDGHNLVFMQKVKEGFSVKITADGQDVVYSVIECETEEPIHSQWQIPDLLRG